MARLEVPQQLNADADALRAKALLLAEFAHELALAEHSGLNKESKVTQRFRAPQTLAVLTAAEQLMRNVDHLLRDQEEVVEGLEEVGAAIEEVRPMVGSGQAAGDDDELDDEI